MSDVSRRTFLNATGLAAAGSLSRASLRRLLLTGSLTAAGSALADEAPTRGGTLTVALEPEPGGLIAGLTISAPAVVVSANLFDGLVDYQDGGKLTPSLAERWEESDDGRTVTFHLRKDVTWHDGKAFTSADVQYSLLEVSKKVHPRSNATFAHLTAVDTPDPHTAILRFSQASPVIWSAIYGTETQILPRHIYEGQPPLTSPNNVKPIGNGAFVFKEWVRGDRLVLERNPNYWDAGKPYLDRIVFRFIKDAGARAAALETGETLYTPLSPAPLSDIARLKENKRLVVDGEAFNGSAPLYFFNFNFDRPLFQDIRVRKAFAHAIDRQALADTVWYGLPKIAQGPIPSYQTQFFKEGLPQYEFDPKKAIALLDEAGHAPDADGVRLKLTHVPLPYGDDYRRSAEFFRQALKRVGVALEIRNYDLPTYLRVIYTDRDFDTQSDWFSCYPDPQIGVQRRFWTKNIKKGVTSSNASGFSDPEFDQVIEAIQNEGDVEKRQALIFRLQELAQTKLPSINLLELAFFRIYSARLKGVETSPFAGYQSLKTVSVGA